LTALGLTVDVTLAENLSPGELNAYHLAIVPSASTLPPELDPHLTKFAKQGGVVYSDRSMAWSSEVFDAPARAGGSSRDARNRLAAALNEVGIPPDREGEVDVSASYRGPYLRRTLGLAELHVFLHRFDADETARIAFQSSRGRHLYAPLHEPGHVENRKRIELAPGQAGMVCTLPYEVSRIAIETAPHAAAGSRLRYALAVRTIGALPGDHVVAVALFDPEGKELKHYRQSHVANAGRAQGYIPLTVNDVPGEYTLRVVDALTGVASETTVEVR